MNAPLPNFSTHFRCVRDEVSADEWQARHSNAILVQSDIRALHSSELPEFDVLIGGIPCTSHSNLGRAKKQLAGKPEPFLSN